MSIVTRLALELGGVTFLAVAVLFGGGVLAATQLQPLRGDDDGAAKARDDRRQVPAGRA